MRASVWAIGFACFLGSCSSSGTTVTDGLVPGLYEITGLRVLSTGAGDARAFKLHFSSVTQNSIAFEITQGDVTHTLPAPQVATKSGDGYSAHWNGNAQFNYTIVFRVGSCEGSDTDGGGGVTPWATCSIRLISEDLR